MSKIEIIRSGQGLSQFQLAKMSGVAQSTISDIERGNISPTVGTIRKLAKALGVPISALLDDDSLSLNSTGTD